MTASELQQKAEQLRAIERALVAQYGNGQASYDPDDDAITVVVTRRPLCISGKFDAARQEVRWGYWYADPEYAEDLPIRPGSETILNAATAGDSAPEAEPARNSPVVLGRDEGVASIYAYAEEQGGVRIELPCYLREIHLSLGDVRSIARLSGDAP